MPGGFDIRSAAEKILSAGNLVEKETLTLENGALDAGDNNVLIKGDFLFGAYVKSTRGLLVKGSLIGTARWPCRVEVGGDVVVVGRVEHAHIAGRNIWVGEGVQNVRMTTSGDVEVGEDVADAQIVVGESEAEKREIQKLQQKILREKQDRDALERRVRLEEKLMDKTLKSTQVTANFSVGQVVQLRRNRVVIDLQPFYRIVGEKTEEEVDRALLEYFAKGIVGLLTRLNRDYIGRNPNRQTIFMGVVRNLRELFFLNRKLDKQSRLIEEDEAHLSRLMDALSKKTAAVRIRGAVGPDVDLQFALPEVKRLEDGDVLIYRQAAKLTVRAGSDGDQREVARVDTRGEGSALSLSSGELRGLSLRAHEGQVVWERGCALVEKDVL